MASLNDRVAVITGGTRGNGVFTWGKPFWEQPIWRWDAMFSAGGRAHYRASQLAAPSMIAKGHGLTMADV